MPSPVRPIDSSQRPSVVRTLVKAFRLRQWVKNGFVSLALLSSGSFLHAQPTVRCGIAVLAFCFLSSSIYLLNDICDRKRDQLHPVKRLRPIASGMLSVAQAAVWSVALFAAAVGMALIYLSWNVAAILAGYAAMNVLYSTWAKHVALLDVLLLAAGFAVRVLAGAFAIEVQISPWLFVVTLFFTLFLALLKRRAELRREDHVPAEHRAVLRHYSVPLLDQLITMTGGSVLVSYALYTFNSVQSSRMMLTIPFVVFAIFRSLLLSYQQDLGAQPEDLLLRDGPMRWNALLFLASFMLVVALR